MYFKIICTCFEFYMYPKRPLSVWPLLIHISRVPKLTIWVRVTNFMICVLEEYIFFNNYCFSLKLKKKNMNILKTFQLILRILQLNVILFAFWVNKFQIRRKLLCLYIFTGIKWIKKYKLLVFKLSLKIHNF